MSKIINCPICGKETRPDYCSDECLYRSDEQYRIIKLLEEQFASSYWSDLSPEFLIALIKGEK